MRRLSEHFFFEELTRSETALRHGLLNLPNAQQATSLERLCETLLEPTRSLLGVQMHINSGFRTAEVNHLVGGAQHSAHLDGRAADFYPIGLDIEDAFQLLTHSSLPFDQVIFECRAWIHLAMSWPGVAPRREALTARRTVGGWEYRPVPVRGIP